MSLSDRLRRLEQQHGAIRWCRCPYDADRQRAETEWAMDSGEPTPSVCHRCRGARVSIQYVPWRELPWHSLPGPEEARR